MVVFGKWLNWKLFEWEQLFLHHLWGPYFYTYIQMTLHNESQQVVHDQATSAEAFYA